MKQSANIEFARFPIRGPSGIRIRELKRLKKIANKA